MCKKDWGDVILSEAKNLDFRSFGSIEPQDDGLSARRIFSVSDLTRHIRLALEEQFISVWVEGEATGVKWHSSGHLYFSLKDENAQINCVMFKQSRRGIDFELADGHAVVCFGRVSVYAPRGQYQLYVERVEPKGIGALQIRFEKMKEKLRLEGLFDEARKRPLPFLPRIIGIITSIDGAAIRDILTVLERRHSSARLLICPAVVQGADAAPSIVKAIEDMNRHGEADVILLARGGGSLEDLWAFNEESVARAITASEIPVLTGIGHETDFTIADFVSDLRAPTPSAAAEMVLPPQEELLLRLEEIKTRLNNEMEAMIAAARDVLENLKKSRGLLDPLYFFETKRQRLDEYGRVIAASAGARLALEHERLGSLMGKLEALGPLAVLRRGFSVTRRGASVLADTKNLKVGEMVETFLAKGQFKSQVKEIRP